MKYTVRWNQGIRGNDIWRVGEERELTTDEFYWMETTYPGCLVPVKPASMPEPKPPEQAPDRPELRAQTPANKRVVAKAPARRPPAKKAR